MASSSPAIAQSAPANDSISVLLGSFTDDEDVGDVSAEAEESRDSARAPFVAAILPRLTLGAIAVQVEQQPTPAPSNADEGAGLRTAGYIAGGVGLVGLALFAIAGLGAKSAYDKLDTDCGNAGCTDPEHRSDMEGGQLLQTAANIGLATGLAGLGVGATLLVLGNRSSTEKRGPSASVFSNGGMITYGGQF